MADAVPALPLIEAESPKKKDKKKKRKLDEMKLDEDEDGEPVKKVKLSKEEKKALKKEKKRERKLEAKDATEVGTVVFHSPSTNRGPHPRISGYFSKEGQKGQKERREGKGKEGKEEQTLILLSPFFPPCFLITSSLLAYL
jgi:nucleolar protein 56